MESSPTPNMRTNYRQADLAAYIFGATVLALELFDDEPSHSNGHAVASGTITNEERNL